MKNSPEPTLVAAIDPRTELIQSADDRIVTLEGRNRALAAQRKQLDLEIEANDEVIRIAKASITDAETSLRASRERALVEQA